MNVNKKCITCKYWIPRIIESLDLKGQDGYCTITREENPPFIVADDQFLLTKRDFYCSRWECKLKNCPFCGGEAILDETYGTVFLEHNYRIRCKDCRAVIIESDIEKVINKWQRRK